MNIHIPKSMISHQKNHLRLIVTCLIISILLVSGMHLSVVAQPYQKKIASVSAPSFSSHYIYGIARYSDGVLAAGAKVEVVSSYGIISDWVNANGEWSINVGDPGPNWADGTAFTAYGIGCCDHDGWSGGQSGMVNGDETNMGTITLRPNKPPETPTVPSGPEHLLVGMNGSYSTKSVDPNYKHTIEYRFDWDSTGEHNYSHFSSSTPSGINVTSSHQWDTPGSYVVTAIARDNYGLKSPWSDGLQVMVYASNTQPQTPLIDGVDEAVKKQDYTFTISGMDPDGHDLYYLIDWDDGTTTSWIGPYDSGESIQVTHAWQSIGTYRISVRAKDVIGNESDNQTHELIVFGPSLQIKTVRAEQGSISVDIENVGRANAEYVEWSIEISGKRLLSGDYTDGIIYVLEAEQVETIHSEPVFGFGFNYDISVLISYEGSEENLDWEVRALILFTFLMLR